MKSYMLKKSYKIDMINKTDKIDEIVKIDKIATLYWVSQNACSSRSLRPVHKTKICHNVTISVVRY